MQHLINFTPTLNWAEPFLLKQMFVKIRQETPPTANRKLHGGDSYAP